MKALIGTIIILLMIVSVSPSYAEQITLPDGTKLTTDTLTDTEVIQAIKTARKSMDAKASTESVIGIVQGVNPQDLEAWAKLITGTIKTICNDLSITVNDFVKTPVGIGAAVLIVYKVMGKDLLENALDIIIMIPLWFILTGIILFLGWYFFSAKTVYERIYYDEKGKKIKEGGHQVSRFPWAKADKSEVPNSVIFAIVLIVAEVFGTALTLMIVLA